jgi:hypothetical protein
MLVRMRRISNPIHCWWECKLVQPLWKSAWRLLKKLKINLLHDLDIPLLGIYPKEYKSIYKRHTCTPMLITPLFTTAKLWNQLRCLTTDDEWIKENVVHHRVLFSH